MISARNVWWPALVAGVVLAGCGGDDRPATDAGPADAAATADGGAMDAGAMDAGTMDAATADAGAMDATVTDAAGGDAGTMDATTSDAGTMDAGATDAGTDAATDAGPPDGGPGPIARPSRGGYVATGERHSCHVRTDGSLWCWGANDRGQRGVADIAPTGDPVRVGTDSDWTVVSADGDDTCGIRAGELYCWGRGTTTPERVGTETDWVWVSLGDDHRCGLREDSSLWCWGDNASGELGIGGGGDRSAPAMVSAGWQLVSAGDDFTCGIRVDGSLWCWGDNFFDQLGVGGGSDRPSPTEVAAGTTWRWVSPGLFHGCGVHTDGSLWCWGAGPIGVSSPLRSAVPVEVADGRSYAMVESSTDHSCAMVDGGSEIRCWGTNSNGELGTGTHGGSSGGPALVAGGYADWVEVDVNDDHSCARHSDDSVSCWGTDEWGQLGRGTVGNESLPKQVGTATDYAAVSAGHFAGCGQTTGGELWCSGVQSQVPSLWDATGFASFHTGGRTCGIRSDGSLECFDPFSPVRVGTASDWTAISVGQLHYCGLRGTDLYCWGDNGDGRLGDGTLTDRSGPVLIGTGYAQVSAGHRGTCAVGTDHTAWCWGLLTATIGSVDPVQVGTDTDWARVEHGLSHRCGIRTDGTLWCWGSASRGKLGIGSSSTAPDPVQVGTDADWIDIEVGRATTCGLRTGGLLYCWGESRAGQIGTGSWDMASTPQAVDSTPAWVDVALEDDTVCGVRTDGTMWCWGRNEEGQIGDDTSWAASP